MLLLRAGPPNVAKLAAASQARSPLGKLARYHRERSSFKIGMIIEIIVKPLLRPGLRPFGRIGPRLPCEMLNEDHEKHLARSRLVGPPGHEKGQNRGVLVVRGLRRFL